MKALFRGFFRITLLPIIRMIYRLRSIDPINVPAEGGVLLISNHVTYIDSFIIYASCPRPVRFVILGRYMESKALAWFLRLFNAIPINQKRPKEALEITAAAVRAGDVVCIFPEGQLTRTGVMNELKKGFTIIAKKAKCPVVPVYMDGLWGSIFSFERDRYFKKWPLRIRYPVSVAFGEPVSYENANPAWAYQTMLDLSESAFLNRENAQFSEPLELAMVRALKHKPWRTMFTEYGKNVRHLKKSQVLGTAVALAVRWTKIPLDDESDRIAVLLPSGPAPAMINLALLMVGKTPVNVPFEVIDDDIAVAGFSKTLDDLGVRTIITSKLFVPRLVDVWDADEGRFIDMMRELRGAGVVRIFLERIFCYFEPFFFTRRRLELDDDARDAKKDEAIGLVPDVMRPAIFLSGMEVQKNAAQIFGADFFRPTDRIFSDLPLNTPEGTHLSLWAPLLRGASIVNRSFSRKLEAEAIEKIVLDEEVTIIVENHDGMEQLIELDEPWDSNADSTVRALIVFSRRSEPSDLERLERRTSVPVCRGWASNIIGQVVAASHPDPNTKMKGQREAQIGFHPDSAGRLLPGFSARIERDFANLFETGELSMKAPTAIAKKVMAARQKELEAAGESERKAILPFSRTNPVELENEPCWIVVAEKAHFDPNGLLYVEKFVGS